MFHPMHLHGQTFQVIQPLRDGAGQVRICVILLGSSSHREWRISALFRYLAAVDRPNVSLDLPFRAGCERKLTQAHGDDRAAMMSGCRRHRALLGVGSSRVART